MTPEAPKKNTTDVWITVYRDSKPMIDGVMIRLTVTVWKLTVANAWQSATITVTTSDSTLVQDDLQ